MFKGGRVSHHTNTLDIFRITHQWKLGIMDSSKSFTYLSSKSSEFFFYIIEMCICKEDSQNWKKKKKVHVNASTERFIPQHNACSSN